MDETVESSYHHQRQIDQRSRGWLVAGGSWAGPRLRVLTYGTPLMHGNGMHPVQCARHLPPRRISMWMGYDLLRLQRLFGLASSISVLRLRARHCPPPPNNNGRSLIDQLMAPRPR